MLQITFVVCKHCEILDGDLRTAKTIWFDSKFQIMAQYSIQFEMKKNTIRMAVVISNGYFVHSLSDYARLYLWWVHCLHCYKIPLLLSFVCFHVDSPAYTFLTLDVIEAMCSCLIAEAEDGELSRRSEVEQERRILTEFGRCLTQVIDSASRTRGMQLYC